ncbi:MAG TPA: hypothetical protein VK671_17165 [Mucilaginibacter sp.]|nr:hypothetical protein [Mucilaginibacter sp.]
MDKFYLIIITHALNMSIANVKAKLGLDSLKPIAEVSFYNAQSIDKGVCIGKYDDKILVVSQDRVFGFYEKEASLFEKQITSLFPDSEIAALTLYDTVDLYGYSIIRGGKRVRIKSGADSEVYIDIGNKLKEEDDVLKEVIFSPDEMKEMQQKYSSKEVERFVENEVGVRVTHALLLKYFDNYEVFDKMQLTEYQ